MNNWETQTVAKFDKDQVGGGCTFLNHKNDFGVYFLSGAWFRLIFF